MNCRDEKRQCRRRQLRIRRDIPFGLAFCWLHDSFTFFGEPKSTGRSACATGSDLLAAAGMAKAMRLHFGMKTAGQDELLAGWKPTLLAGFAEEFWGGQPDEFAAGGNETFEFDHGDAGFFQRGDVVGGAEGGGDEIVEMRGVAEEEDGG